MKTILITGGSEGLGAALGRIAVKNGTRVVCLSRHAPDYAAEHLSLDLADPGAIEAAAETIKERYADFGALINCAGIMSVQSPDAISYEQLQQLMAVYLLAPLFLTSQLFDLIKQNEADIVNVGSTVGSKAYEDQAAYGMSKWGIRGLSTNLQLELKKTPCRVIQFNPGGFKSRIAEKATGKLGDLSAYMEPADLAELLWFILKLPKQVEVSEILVNRK